MSENSPDGVDGNKSAKTWAMSAISAESNAKQSEVNANLYKNAAASSASASADSASASSASATNSANSAKASASSASAAKTSEANAKTSADKAKISETKCVDKINELNTALKNGFTTASLTVSGETSVPTPATTNNSNTIANTEFVHGVVSELVNGAPTALDTLQELASALGNDPNFSTTILNKIGEKENKTDAQIEYKKLQDSIDTKQNLLTFDTTPKYGSENPVTSDGIKKAVEAGGLLILDADGDVVLKR